MCSIRRDGQRKGKFAVFGHGEYCVFDQELESRLRDMNKADKIKCTASLARP